MQMPILYTRDMPTRYDAAVQMLRVFEVDEVPYTNKPKISLKLQ